MLFSSSIEAATPNIADAPKWTPEFEVEFKVKIEQPLCKILVGPDLVEKATIELGSIPNRPGSVGPIVPVKFQFTDCIGMNSVANISYINDLTPGNNNGPQDGVIKTKFDHIQIQLFADKNGKFTFPQTGWTGSQTIVGNSTEIFVPFYAQAQVIGVGDATPFSGTAQFLVTYN